MPISVQESSQLNNDGTLPTIVSSPSIVASHLFTVATFPTRTITLASAARRHHNVFTPSPHPTIVCALRLDPYQTHNSQRHEQLCVVVAIASVYFLDLHMHSEVTSNATANPPLLLTYSSLLLSLFGVLSSALRVVPAIGIELQDQPFTLVERHLYPSIHVLFQAEMDPVDSHMVRGPSDSPWPSLSKG